MTQAGLRVIERVLRCPGEEGLIDALRNTRDSDVVLLTTPLARAAAQLLFAGSAAVLANSGHEPFGLVGLEAMAAGGIVGVGGTGEDYIVPGWNGLVLQTNEPGEFITAFRRLQSHPQEKRSLRHNGLVTAGRFAWAEIVQRVVLPRLSASVRAVDERSPIVNRAMARRRQRSLNAGYKDLHSVGGIP